MGPEQWLFLQWHEHKGSLVSMFEKLFERNTFVDCTLAAEGQYLNVHKVILSACSPYFELLLNENRDKHPIIILKDVKFRSLKSIIEYMYRGEANVLSSDIKDFLAAAESLQIKGIGKHGGDTKNQPKKALQDFVEGEGRSPHSPKIYPGSGDNDKRTVTDFHEIKSDDEDDESGRDKNFCYIENVEHHSNISPQKIPVPIITSETNAETQWLKAESPEDTAQYLMSMPTLNIGACTTDIVHPGLKETVPERTANKISTQNVLPCDVQMKKAEMSRSETKCELQPASPIVDNEVADSASQASSVRELSDTAEEWAEEEMEEALTHSHTTGNSVVGGTDESRAHFDGGSDATRESRDLGSDQQGKCLETKRKLFDRTYEPRRCLRREKCTKKKSPSQETANLEPIPKTVSRRNSSESKSLKTKSATRTVSTSDNTNANTPPRSTKSTDIKCDAQESPKKEDKNQQEEAWGEEKTGSAKTFEETDESKPNSPERSQCAMAAITTRPQRIHTCPICKKEFPWLCVLKAHLDNHVVRKPYKCEECAYVSSTLNDFIAHKRVHNWRNTKDSSQPARRGFSAERLYKLCMSDFTSDITVPKRERSLECGKCDGGSRDIDFIFAAPAQKVRRFHSEHPIKY